MVHEEEEATKEEVAEEMHKSVHIVAKSDIW
jgi:hypothetical protein